MEITLFLNEKIINFKLPSEISGSYSFDASEIESKLINVEARNEYWTLYETTDVKIIQNNKYLESIQLVPNNFYILKKEEKTYLIFVSDLNVNSFSIYKYDTNLKLSIGNTDSCNIKYNCEYLKSCEILIYIKNNVLVLENKDNSVIYINKTRVVNNTYNLTIGDEIEIYGLRIIIINGFILINKLNDKITINKDDTHIELYVPDSDEKPKDFEIKDVDLYQKNDYFYKSPRIRRIIETKTIKFSAPPKDGNNQEMPMALVVGPMLTMGAISVITIMNTMEKVASKQTTLDDAMPQLLTSGIMLVSMLVWPLLTQFYNRFTKKSKARQIVKKYSKYLNDKKKVLEEEKELQKSILLENLITVEECLKIIEQRKNNFWDKRLDQNDIMTVRIGVGDELLDVKFEYPEEEFAIEENKLREKADELVSQYKYIPYVPISYSFYDNRITAIMGNDYQSTNFMNNIIIQLLTFYSYDDLKLVVFTNENNEKRWDYIKYLNYNFNNSKDIRFFGSDADSIKEVCEYLNFELNNRLNEQKNDGDTPKPYYFIIVDDYDKVKRQEFIKTLTEIDENYGFSLVILEQSLGKLPSKCNNFITLAQKNSGVLKNSYEKQEQIKFRDEIHYGINMMRIAKILSNIPIEFEEGIKQLPSAISFLEMEKVGKVEQLNVLNRWNSNDPTTTLRTEVGVDEEGELMYLDLHEKYHGPHGLIAGMTGSGKSEFIITYILSMAMNYSPDYVSFILIDYKGGGLAYAFENKTNNIVLPHLAGTITNLDKAEMDRTLVSIDAEIKRRQHVFNEARDSLGESTIDIYKYQRYYQEGKLTEPVPHLFIICDEFAELKSQQPEFMDNLISVARIGRSLGVHLILATQKPSGVVNDQIWSNTKFRVCLKVQDEQDSKEMLKRPEAASLKQTGRFYLQVGYNEYFALGQSAWCGAKYYPSDKPIINVDKSINFINDCGTHIKSIQASGGVKVPAQGEQLSAIINTIIDVSKMADKKARKLWLENIPNIILISDLENKYPYNKQPFNVETIIGEYDAPEKQEQGLVKFNYLEQGNTLVYGTDGSEREMLLNSIIYGTAKNHTAEEVNIYVIDYGSESLGKWNSLPQVGGVVFSSEEEKYNNLFKQIKEEIQNRKKLFVDFGGEYKNYIVNSGNKLPLKVIIINNYDSVYESNPNIYEELPELVRDSERYGIIFILTANASNSVHSKISQNFHNTYAFKVKDSSEYSSIFGVRTKIVPRDIDGRGLINNDGIHEFQVASITSDETKLNGLIQEFISNQKSINKYKAKRIPTLPEIVRYEDIQEEISTIKNVPIGIDKKELEITTIDYLSVLGNIITSNKLANTKNFVVSLLENIRTIKNTSLIIFDSMKLLNLNREIFKNYYTDNLEVILDSIIDFVKKLIDSKSNQEGIILIYGLNKFISKINNSSKIQTLAQYIKEYEKISLIVVDDASKIKSFAFETWFTTLFSVNDGIWVGRGISDQNLLHLSNVNKDMMKDCKNNMGYLINEGQSTFLKLLDYITKDEEDKNAK